MALSSVLRFANQHESDGDMAETHPTTQKMKASQAHRQWNPVLDQVSRGETRILVERDGIPVAAIVSADDLEQLDRLEAERAARWRVIEEIGARHADIDPDEVERDVDEAIAEMRAEDRASTPASHAP